MSIFGLKREPVKTVFKKCADISLRNGFVIYFFMEIKHGDTVHSEDIYE